MRQWLVLTNGVGGLTQYSISQRHSFQGLTRSLAQSCIPALLRLLMHRGHSKGNFILVNSGISRTFPEPEACSPQVMASSNKSSLDDVLKKIGCTTSVRQSKNQVRFNGWAWNIWAFTSQGKPWPGACSSQVLVQELDGFCRVVPCKTLGRQVGTPKPELKYQMTASWTIKLKRRDDWPEYGQWVSVVLWAYSLGEALGHPCRGTQTNIGTAREWQLPDQANNRRKEDWFFCHLEIPRKWQPEQAIWGTKNTDSCATKQGHWVSAELCPCSSGERLGRPHRHPNQFSNTKEVTAAWTSKLRVLV